MAFAVADFVGNDAPRIGIEEVVIIIDRGFGDRAVNGENIVIGGQLGPFETEHLIAGKTAFCFDLDVGMKGRFADLVKVLEIFMEVPSVFIDPIDVHTDLR